MLDDPSTNKLDSLLSISGAYSVQSIMVYMCTEGCIQLQHVFIGAKLLTMSYNNSQGCAICVFPGHVLFCFLSYLPLSTNEMELVGWVSKLDAHEHVSLVRVVVSYIDFSKAACVDGCNRTRNWK